MTYCRGIAGVALDMGQVSLCVCCGDGEIEKCSRMLVLAPWRPVERPKGFLSPPAPQLELQQGEGIGGGGTAG